MGAELVRRELEQLLERHAPDASTADVDEIVLDYISEVLGELGAEESSFNVDEFTEMVSAYVPEFSSIESSVVWEWVFELVDKQRSVSKSSNSEDHYIQKSTRNVTKSERVSDFEAETCDEPRQSVVAESSTACDGDRDSVALLQEMFPGVTEQTVSGALVRCKGDLELAIQELLAQSETKMLRDRKKEMESTAHSKEAVCCDSDIKESLLARYAFVDKNEDKVTHRPVLAKSEQKKMVRYRDGQVVSTKGERFTILTRKDKEGEDMKKTYVNIKPLRKYRFH